MTDREVKMNAFLDELTDLRHKYDIGIGGCGCCDSPWVFHDIRDENSIDVSRWMYYPKRRYDGADNFFGLGFASAQEIVKEERDEQD